ncbi:MAG TPA: FAD-dependent monooxygenase, partial [Gemmataceae bacterium]|nr:FAD-dependent monooxygenase [Gemmataceae bacterium]
MTDHEEWDAVVVGAGPAGSVTARELARGGARVLLVDKATFPRPKVCGCCLNRATLAALRAVGLGHIPARCGAVPLSRVKLAAGRSAADVLLPGGVAVSREAFDAALAAEAANRGAELVQGTRAALVDDDDPNWRRLRLTRGGEVGEARARVVLAADGLGGGLLTRAGLGHADVRADSRIGAGAVFASPMLDYERHVIHMASGHGGYAGLVRLEDDRLDVAA